jgi:hypothetical protein
MSRLRTICTLTDAGIPVSVSVAPIIPFVTEFEIEHILEAARRQRCRRSLHRAAPAARSQSAIPGMVANLFSGPRAAGDEPHPRYARRQGLGCRFVTVHAWRRRVGRPDPAAL